MSSLVDIDAFSKEEREFWGLATDEEMAEAQATLSRRKRKEYAEEHSLLVYKGRLTRPEDYPCKCELQSPHQCAEERNGRQGDDNYCKCPCHRFFEGF